MHGINIPYMDGMGDEVIIVCYAGGCNLKCRFLVVLFGAKCILEVFEKDSRRYEKVLVGQMMPSRALAFPELAISHD